MIKTTQNLKNWNRVLRKKIFLEADGLHGRKERSSEKYPKRIVDEELEKLEEFNDETPGQ